MNKALLRSTNELAQRISKDKKVIAVVLFGSQVTGRAHKDSDIDLAVVSSDNNVFSGYSSELFDVSSFWQLPLNIKFRVIKEGKILFCRDSNQLSAIYSDITRKYLDYSSFMQKFYRRLISNV